MDRSIWTDESTVAEELLFAFQVLGADSEDWDDDDVPEDDWDEDEDDDDDEEEWEDDDDDEDWEDDDDDEDWDDWDDSDSDSDVSLRRRFSPPDWN